jgi:recombination protein RecA
MYSEGISKEGDLLDVALDLGVMEKRGSYYYYDSDDFLAQGRENTKEFLRENPDVAESIEVAVREKMVEEGTMAPSALSSDVEEEDDAE